MTLVNIFKKRDYDFKTEVVSGLTVALALVPELRQLAVIIGVIISALVFAWETDALA